MGNDGSRLLEVSGDELEEANAQAKHVAPRTSSAKSIGKVRKARSIKITGLPALARRSVQLSKWKGRRLQGQLCGVIRHAERADGIYAFIGGQRWTQTEDFQRYPLDPPLSDAGVEAAKEMGQQVADLAAAEGVSIHIVISSPYFRCVQTAVEVCCKLGPHIRLIIDLSLGEVYGSCVMGAFEPLHTVRPIETTLRYCAFKDVTVVSRPVGAQPTWSEDLKSARRRYAKGYLSYLHRSALAKRNFVIVTHADCVGAALSMMPSQAGFAVESVEYGGMMLATRGADAGQVDKNAGIMHETVVEEDYDFEEIVPGARGSKPSASPGLNSQSSAGQKKSAWEDEDGSNASDLQSTIDAFSRSPKLAWAAPPKEADGWRVRVHNINTRAIPKEKVKTSAKAMKSVKNLLRNTSYSQEQIETLLGMMSDKSLDDDQQLFGRQPSSGNKMPDSRVLSKTDCSLATYVFGMSENGSNMDDCRSQCSENEFAYMATYGLPASASREATLEDMPYGVGRPSAASRQATLDLIDEKPSCAARGEPNSPGYPSRLPVGSDLNKIIESRRTSTRGRDISPGRHEDGFGSSQAISNSQQRSITLEELRNLNEAQKRELISASVAERRERLGARGHAGRQQPFFKGQRSPYAHSRSPQAASREGSPGSRHEFDGRAKGHTRALFTIQSVPGGKDGCDEEGESMCSSRTSGQSCLSLARKNRVASAPAIGEESAPTTDQLKSNGEKDRRSGFQPHLTDSTVDATEDGNMSSAGSVATSLASSVSCSPARPGLERGRPTPIQVDRPQAGCSKRELARPAAIQVINVGQPSAAIVQAVDVNSPTSDAKGAGSTRFDAGDVPARGNKRELSRPSPIQVVGSKAEKDPPLECLLLPAKDSATPGTTLVGAVKFEARTGKRELARPAAIQVAGHPSTLECVPVDQKDAPKLEENIPRGVVILAESPPAACKASDVAPAAAATPAPDFAGSSLMQRRAQRALTGGATVARPPALARPSLTITKTNPGLKLEPLVVDGIGQSS